jgi:hypothetical protein
VDVGVGVTGLGHTTLKKWRSNLSRRFSCHDERGSSYYRASAYARRRSDDSC